MFDDEDDNEKQCIRPKTCGILSFHNGTEEAMFIYIENYSQKGQYDEIINAIDRFCYSRHWMMHIGDKKGKILESTIFSLLSKNISDGNTRKGRNFLELGSYCGYSSIRIGHLLSKYDKLYCIERESKCVEWTLRLVYYAELSDKISVIHGIVDDHYLNYIVQDIQSNGSYPVIDFLFIDHDKMLYKSDLEVIINAGLLKSGSIVFTDNVLSFNTPLSDYLNFVKDPQGFFSSSTTIQESIEYAIENEDSLVHNIQDGVEISIFR